MDVQTAVRPSVALRGNIAKRKACSYVNFSSKVHCHGCKESKNWDRGTEKGEGEKVTRLKSEKDEREAREKGRELGWPEGWKWEDLEDEQLLESI